LSHGAKLEGIGFGFFVPIFFVTTGIVIGHRAAVGRRKCGDRRQVERLKEETAASLVGAGMTCVLLFPIAALSLRRTAGLRQHAQSEVAMPDKLA
jgi:hypothetical protein